MFETKLFTTLLTLFLTNIVIAQTEIEEIIKSQAETTARATVEGDYELLLKYTHPNIIKHSGGKQKILKILKSQMDQMAESGASIDAVDIGDPIDTQLFKGEYQTLVPKTLTMTMNGQKVISNDYLFGFSDSKGEKWTFVEAQKLKTDRTKLLFPNFETEIVIPEKENPIIIDDEGDIEVLEFDENAGTYADTDKMVDMVFGFIGLGIGVLFLIVIAIAVIFLIIYYKKKNKKEVPEKVVAKSTIAKVDKVICAECDGKNRSDSKYCAFCGYSLGS